MFFFLYLNRRVFVMVSKGNVLDFYFTALQLVLVLCGGRRNSPHTLP